MKKIIVIAAAALMALAPAVHCRAQESGKDEDLTLKTGKRINANMQVILPVYFGASTLTGIDYRGPWAGTGYGNFLDTKLYQNFCFGIEMIGLRLSSRNSPVEANMALRWSFMDFSLADTSVSFSGDGSPSPVTMLPVHIVDSNPLYDGTKSKVHASYLGMPLRVTYRFAKHWKLYAGVSGDVLVNGYTKYRQPAKRSDARTLFSPLRASVEGGIAWYGIGLWASYGLTPLFLPDCSSARTLSFGLVFGI